MNSPSASKQEPLSPTYQQKIKEEIGGSPTYVSSHTPFFSTPKDKQFPNYGPAAASKKDIDGALKKESTPLKWFSLATKKKCEDVDVKEETKPRGLGSGRNIVAPNVKQLSQDPNFLESCHDPFMANPPPLHYLGIPPPLDHGKKSLLGLPSGLDIQQLIEQDPQKAAELLEIQLSVPQDIPEDKRHGWWRITDPEQMQRIMKSVHPR